MESIQARVRSMIQEHMEKNQSVGISAAVVQNENTILSEGFGNAQIHEYTIPMTADTLMNLQSVSKIILAISIMQLVEKGEIQLDAPVVKYVPYFQTKNKEISDEITIKHLLTHTTGFPQNIGITHMIAPNAKAIFSDTPDEYEEALSYYGLTEEEVLRIRNREDITKWFAAFELTRKPGEEWEYFTAGYTLLADVLEKVTKMKWEAYIQKYIFEPLEMNGTTTYMKEYINSNQKAQYYLLEGLKQTPLPLNQLAAPSGFVYSTANDMAKFMSCLIDGQSRTLLDSSYLKEMMKPHIRVCSKWEREGNPTYYGYGFFVEEFQGTTLVEHDGSQLGVRAIISMVPSARIAVAVLMNCDDKHYYQLARNILRLLLDDKKEK
ncbi:serine hydrolase domain-containing protein [Aneurinibacillus aneurinilyticus]|jgi:CubicO group peptidase (beta-lactamase class C family)|uniref:serine hydrolase domain-containing protein n=1 Tax=Aneurinibacillus aneurinilyticus TaxID=1391 RepID=UPI0023F6B7B2|nr:serine hydrolase domain-containing protein [Aneurinibacillus aneurinilyticus]MCI1696021.1 beta-lactamase family protein [Aneurinibacillus aneurinilyticus]